MAEELKHLLDRIQKEGVDKAEDQATQIIAEAREEAARIVAEAESRAKEAVEKAEREADAFAQRGTQSLQHAARDVVLSVGDTVTRLMESLVRQKTEAALAGEALTEVVVAVVKAYFTDAGGKRDVTLLVAPDQRERFQAIVMSQLGEALSQGLEVQSDNSVASGFRVTVKGEHVEHSFTAAAIADALCELLRPHLAEIVRSAGTDSPAARE